jgi:predicted ATP-binding protein involved in virulence
VLEQPSKRLIQSLANLDNDNDFKEVLDWMKRSLQQIQHDSLNTKDEVQTRWYQGAGQAIDEFLVKATQARETIRKF